MTAFCFAQSPQLDRSPVQLGECTARENIIAEIAKSYNRVDADSLYYYCDLLLKDATQSGDPIQLAQANTVMGIYWQNLQPANALDYFRQAYETYKITNNKEKMVNVNNMMAVTYHYLNDYDKQLFYLKKALQDVLELDNKRLEISILHHISEVYLYLKNYQLSEEYSSMALQESHNNNNWMLDTIMIAQAGIEFQKGNFTRSIGLNEEVFARVHKKGQTKMEMICLSNMAECYMALKQYKEARRMLEQCHHMNSSESYMTEYYKNLQLLISLDSVTGNFKQAFYNQRTIDELTAKRYLQKQVRNISEKAMLAELQHLEAQFSHLETLYQEQEEQSTKMNIVMIVLIVTACGGAALLLWARHSLKQLKQGKNKLLTAQKMLVEKKNKLSDNYKVLCQKNYMLIETHDRLKQSDRSKTELFKNISHDLQTPLIHLQHNLTELITSDINENQFRLATNNLSNSVGDVSLLLENLLQWSKFQSQDINTKSQYIEIMALVNDVIKQHKFSAAEKSITLSNILEHRLYVYADEDLVKSLLKIILQNIIKLSGSNAVITVSGSKNKKHGNLQINYWGIMPLKEMYLSLSQTDHYSPEQTELGKAISLGWMLCRTLIKTNHGGIQVKDVSPESFNIFLSFPLEEPATGNVGS